MRVGADLSIVTGGPSTALLSRRVNVRLAVMLKSEAGMGSSAPA